MVALPLVPIAVSAALGIFASVVHKIKKHHNHLEMEIRAKVQNPLPKDRDDVIQSARIKINGEMVTFIRVANQIFAPYELAIDYCTSYGMEALKPISLLIFL